ncbi:MAG: geranylgeranylglyceryl/heptaprenylglyceryl phosphate synthase [Thermoplasmata archaeon]|nr:geranylgeranylglyceryl/heptaprenylglyceryl phosphate synthase [Thermoplasmata archaeon]MBE3137849.1 geranylgeranylglyceryl/heptaprenylglyceryl phosphate synthase [Thermoplasmata archaeon]MBE3139123.1 geranylgeranylglyceryl/heptaprenylglyceryl phosphate synthase [Thermoplasmata archaeon]
MTIADTIVELARKKRLHFALLDPDKQKPSVAGHIAQTVSDAGSSAIMVGGSTLLSQKQVDETVQAIKKNSDLPVILFPSSAKFLSKYADAVFFMSLLNSNNLDYVIREHVKGAPFVKYSGLEPISMGYVIVEPGMMAGRVGEAELIKRDDPQTAVGYALAAEYLGMKFFYIEAGSGAPTPVPNEMIQAVKKNTSIPVIVGGGIRDSKTAKEKVRAGADIIITGTAIEKDKHFKTTLTDIVNAIEGM